MAGQDWKQMFELAVAGLPLSAQIGGVIVVTSLAGIFAVRSGARLCAGKLRSGILNLGLGLFMLLGLIFTAWASS